MTNFKKLKDVRYLILASIRPHHSEELSQGQKVAEFRFGYVGLDNVSEKSTTYHLKAYFVFCQTFT